MKRIDLINRLDEISEALSKSEYVIWYQSFLWGKCDIIAAETEKLKQGITLIYDLKQEIDDSGDEEDRI